MALALLAGGCGQRGVDETHGSVTVKLPPPRPAVSAPGFEFEGPRNPRA